MPGADIEVMSPGKSGVVLDVNEGKQVYIEVRVPSVFRVQLGGLIKYSPRTGVYDLPSKVMGDVGTPGGMSGCEQGYQYQAG